MAEPFPYTYTQWDGTRGMTRWYVAWDGSHGDDFTDAIVVNLITLSPQPTSVKVRRVDMIINGDIQVDLEFDVGAPSDDELIDRFCGQSDMTNPIERDYTDGPSVGWTPIWDVSGFVGDILLTTLGAVSGDELNLLIIYEAS